jgi:hypothetical protein
MPGVGNTNRTLQAQVTDLLTFPQHHCPDVLVLGLLQINPPITILRQATHTPSDPVQIRIDPKKTNKENWKLTSL